MRSWAKLMVDENTELGRLYRNSGGQPIGGEVAIWTLHDHSVFEVSLTGLRPLGGDTKIPQGPLTAAASARAYQAWLFSERDENVVKMGLLNADQNGLARMAVDFDPNDVSRAGRSINGYDYVAIAPVVEGCDSLAAITIAFARLPGDLATFQDRPNFPDWLTAEPYAKEKTIDWAAGDGQIDYEATTSREGSRYPWEASPHKSEDEPKTYEYAFKEHAPAASERAPETCERTQSGPIIDIGDGEIIQDQIEATPVQVPKHHRIRTRVR